MIEVTYARLEEVLLSLGFSFNGIYQKNRIFRHAETGAMVIYPEFPADTTVLPRHLSGVKSILNAYGIADPDGFTLDLQRAS
jgi:hypothetical protein